MVHKDGGMPDPVTREDIEACDKAGQKVLEEAVVCEKNVDKLNQDTDAEIGSMVKDYKDIDADWARIQANQKDIHNGLQNLYDEEERHLNDLHEALKPVNPHASEAPALTFLQSRQHEPFDPTLIDRWLACDNRRKSYQGRKDACEVRTKTVTTWNKLRVKQYTDKADVYINRAARQSQPLRVQQEEFDRVTASNERLAANVKEIQDITEGHDLYWALHKTNTPGWTNGYDTDCKGYVDMGYCAGGEIVSGQEWTGKEGHYDDRCKTDPEDESDRGDCAQLFNHPQQNCVACGKGNTVATYEVGDQVQIDGEEAVVIDKLGDDMYAVDYRDGHTSYEEVSAPEMSYLGSDCSDDPSFRDQQGMTCADWSRWVQPGCEGMQPPMPWKCLKTCGKC